MGNLLQYAGRAGSAAVAEKLYQRRREQDDRRSKDRRDHTRHVELQRQMLRLRGENFAALLAARMMNRNTARSEEHTSELQSLMRISYAVFCLKKKKQVNINPHKSTLNETTHET